MRIKNIKHGFKAFSREGSTFEFDFFDTDFNGLVLLKTAIRLKLQLIEININDNYIVFIQKHLAHIFKDMEVKQNTETPFFENGLLISKVCYSSDYRVLHVSNETLINKYVKEYMEYKTRIKEGTVSGYKLDVECDDDNSYRRLQQTNRSRAMG